MHLKSYNNALGGLSPAGKATLPFSSGIVEGITAGTAEVIFAGPQHIKRY
jgi:hypothetical protein